MELDKMSPGNRIVRAAKSTKPVVPVKLNRTPDEWKDLREQAKKNVVWYMYPIGNGLSGGER